MTIIKIKINLTVFNHICINLHICIEERLAIRCYSTNSFNLIYLCYGPLNLGCIIILPLQLIN